MDESTNVREQYERGYLVGATRWGIGATIATGSVLLVCSVFTTLRPPAPPIATAQAAEVTQVNLWALTDPSQACKAGVEAPRSARFVGWSKDDGWVPTRTVWCLRSDGNNTDMKLITFTQAEGASEATERRPLWPDPVFSSEFGIDEALATICAPGKVVGWSAEKPSRSRFEEQGRLVRETDGIRERVIGAKGGTLLCLENGELATKWWHSDSSDGFDKTETVATGLTVTF